MEMGWTDNGSGEWEIDDREKDDDRDRGSSKKKSNAGFRCRLERIERGAGISHWIRLRNSVD